MRVSSLSYLACASLAAKGALAASYDDIPTIEVYGQHFFYTNNGTQLCVSVINLSKCSLSAC
jgi:hypothetical protein